MSPQPLRPPILETNRLRLEPLTTGDGPLLFPMMADSQVMAFWDVAEIDDPDVVTQMVENQMDEMAKGRGVFWAIRTLADATFIGTCDLSDIDRRHKRAEVAFMLDRESWGNGYAQEAMTSITTYAASVGLRRLLARTQLGSRPSDSLLEKSGFQEEGILRGFVERDGERRDCRLFGLLL